MAGRLSFTVGFLIVASVGLLHGACAASIYMVGDDLGWTVPPNSSYYEEWASQRTFQIGDTFVFNWTAGTHSATEEFKSLSMQMVRTTSSALKEHSEQGQKMVIKIGDGIAPSFAAPSLAAAAALTALLLSTVAIFFLN